jgi:sortase A
VTRGARIAVRIGFGLFTVGLLLVAFVAYQLWGTSLYEERAQSHLKTELSHQIHAPLPTTSAQLTGTQRLGLPPLANQTAPTSAEPAADRPVGLLSIPKIGLLDAIVQGVGESQLEQGPGHYPGTALPGEPGNASIAGHRTTYAHPFYNLNELGPGDNVYILTAQGLFEYTVTGSQIVAPTDVAVLNPTPGRSTLTLTTCNPRYSAATRLVVTAAFDGHTAAATTPTTRPIVTALAGDGSSSLSGGGASAVSPILWGLLTVAIAVAATVLWRLARRRVVRVGIVVVAAPLFVVTLLVCFEHASLALPGSF